MIAITGATGNTGKVAAESLLESGEKVRAIGRSAEKIQPLVEKGAEAFVGDVADSAAMTRAFSGADAVYLMIPPDLKLEDFRGFQERVSDSYASAVKASGVRQVVMLSSIGGEKSERTGPIVGLHNMEEKIKALGDVNGIFLRPDYFMENNLMQIGLIHAMGLMGGTYRGDVTSAQIATLDIGAFAADALRLRNATGCTARALHGPRDVTFDECARILGVAVGKPGLSYKKVPDFMAQVAMKQMGMPEKTIKSAIEMAEAFNDGWIAALEPRTPQNTGKTTLEAWATDVFAPAYNAKKK